MSTSMSTSQCVEHVIRPDQLQVLTLQGWAVVERFEEDAPIHITESVLPTAQNGYQPSPMPMMKSQMGKQSYFRVRKDGETVISELNDQIANLTSKLYQAERSNETFDKEIEGHKKEIERLKADCVVLRNENERTRKQREQIEQVKRQLEADIGKIREHVGKKMMEEILGPAR